MANFTDANDLREDALWLAGEPIDASSSYYAKALDYVNAVQSALVLGGSLGPEAVQPVDWWWARKFPRGVLRLEAAEAVGTIHLNQNSASVSFASMTTGRQVLYNYVVIDQTPRWGATVITHATGQLQATLATTWPYATTTTDQVVVAPVFVNLPGDFLRFVTPVLTLTADRFMEVVDSRTLDELYPLPRVQQGTPIMAAVVSYSTGLGNYLLRLSHYPDQHFDVEFEYINTPALMVGGSTPPMPVPHRRLLSFGAAFLLLLDKGDSSAEVRYRQFISAWETMADEHGKQTARGGSSHGRILARGRNVSRFPLRTASGLIIG